MLNEQNKLIKVMNKNLGALFFIDIPFMGGFESTPKVAAA